MVEHSEYPKPWLRFPWTLTVAALSSFAMFAALLLPTFAQQSTNPINQQGRQLSLYDQLRVGLKAVTKDDFSFINKVVLLVDAGKLPRRLVDSTFLWARRRAALKSPRMALRPMVYFKPGLTLRAKGLGLQLDKPVNMGS